MILIITGPQGSGKGTQADLLANKFGLLHVESGEILRELSKKDIRIKEMIDNGVIVPDEETLNYIERFIEDSRANFENIIFDGYPRSVEQYQKLKVWLQSKGCQIDYALVINVSDAESIKRISARRTCVVCGKVYNLLTNPPEKEGCSCGGKLITRDDDKESTIKKRLQIYNEKTKPIIDEYKKDNVLIEVDGERPIEIIFADIVKKLNERGIKS